MRCLQGRSAALAASSAVSGEIQAVRGLTRYNAAVSACTCYLNYFLDDMYIEHCVV